MKNIIKIILFLLPLTTQCMKRDNKELLNDLYKHALWAYKSRKPLPSHYRMYREAQLDLHHNLVEGHSVFSAIAIQEISFNEKQEFIQKLQFVKPTDEDKKLAHNELWERRKPIITKILLIRNTNNLPNDVLNVIALLILQTEKPLF